MNIEDAIQRHKSGSSRKRVSTDQYLNYAMAVLIESNYEGCCRLKLFVAGKLEISWGAEI